MPEIDDFLLEDEPNDVDTPSAEEEVASLREEIATLKKESYGRLQETKGERQKRQHLQVKLDKLTGTVENILQNRQSDNNGALPNTPGVIGVDETDSGELFIREDKLATITAPLEKRINELQQALEAAGSANERRNEAQEVINAIVGENDSYDPAYKKYQSARKWVNDQVIDYQKDNNLSGVMTSGQALDNVFDADMEATFNERFPTLALEEIVTAEDSQRHFRKMLDSISTRSVTPDSTDDTRFRKVLQKPSTLGVKSNAKSAELNVSEKLAGVQPTDIMNMSDAQIRALEKALLSEENAEGIQF
jgi:hypothetical protein